jgi:nitronate monooxygenase
LSTPTRRQFITTTSAAIGVGAEPAVTSIPTERAKALVALFGLKYPIFEAPHGNMTCPELAIAVSNAGALGALGLSLASAEEARAAVSTVRSATKAAFFINYILAGEEPSESFRAALDAGAPIVQFSWGLPANATISAIRRAGAKLGIQVTSAEGARAALDAGADYLVCQGTEAGGHVQASRGLYEALPIVLQEAKEKPVIASGGIGNGAGIRKALLAGASAAMLGTRFVATTESYAHQDYKQALVAAHAHDTALTICFQDGWPALHRVLRNRTFVMWERAGCPSPGKRPGEGELVATQSNGEKELRYSALPPERNFHGAAREMALYAGLGVEYVKDLPSAGELVQRLWRECETAK